MLSLLDRTLILRLCHDLITPCNAITLGIDAYESDGDASFLPYIKDSVLQANALLEFLRELFSQKNENFIYNEKSLNTLIANVLKRYHINFHLTSDDSSIPYILGYFSLYSGIILKEVMPMGGDAQCTIFVSQNLIRTEYSGRDIRLPETISADAVVYKNVFEFVLFKELTENRYTPMANFSDDNAVFTISKIA